MTIIEWFGKVWESIKNFDPEMGIAICGIGAAFLTIVTVLYTYQKGVDEGKKADTLSGKVDDGNRIGISSNQILAGLEKRNKELEEEVRLLRTDNESLRNASIIINDNITGGNSSCYLDFVPSTDGFAYVFLHQNGDFPLREIEIFIYDNKSRQKYSQHYTIVKVSSRRKFIMKIPFDRGNENLFSIFISSFNNNWNQQVVISPGTSSSRGLLFESFYRVYQLFGDPVKRLKFDYKLIMQGGLTGADGSKPRTVDWGLYKNHLLETEQLLEKSIK